MRKMTPWGTADSEEVIAPGVTAYTTASHGGIHLCPELQARMPKYMQGGKYCGEGFYAWYEEDCEWCLPVVALPDLPWPTHMRDMALSTFHAWYPEQYMRFQAENQS